MGILNQAVKDGVGQSSVANDAVPVLDGKLTTCIQIGRASCRERVCLAV